jgi:hypothetical protein
VGAPALAFATDSHRFGVSRNQIRRVPELTVRLRSLGLVHSVDTGRRAGVGTCRWALRE